MIAIASIRTLATLASRGPSTYGTWDYHPVEKSVALGADVVETYVPVMTTVAYARQTPAPKPGGNHAVAVRGLHLPCTDFFRNSVNHYARLAQ
jgi:hypothetical protein